MCCVIIRGLAKSQPRAPSEGQLKRDFSQAVSKGEDDHVTGGTGNRAVEGAPLRLLGGPRPRSTLKVALEGRQRPLSRGSWRPAQRRAHGAQKRGWDSREGAACRREEGLTPAPSLAAQAVPKPSHAAFHKRPIWPICLSRGPSSRNLQPGPGAQGSRVPGPVSEVLARGRTLCVPGLYRVTSPHSCMPAQPGHLSSYRPAPGAGTAQGRESDTTCPQRLQGDKRQRPSCPRPQNQDIPTTTQVAS